MRTLGLAHAGHTRVGMAHHSTPSQSVKVGHVHPTRFANSEESIYALRGLSTLLLASLLVLTALGRRRSL